MKSPALRFLVFLIVLQLLIPFFLKAQGHDKEANNWQFTIAPYMLFPSLKGELGLSVFNEEIDAGLSDVLDRLKFGAMVYSEMKNDNWIFSLDILYINIGTKELIPDTEIEAKVDLDQLILELVAMKKIAKWAGVGIGIRYNSVGTDIRILESQNIPEIAISKRQNWPDPIVVGRLQFPLANKFRLGFNGDVGGFGMKSKITWQVHLSAGYNVSELIEFGIAWRWIGIDYESGSGFDRFKYNLVIYGPEAALVFHF